MANYYVLLTDYGKSFIANAQANTQLELTHVVLGDANNQPYLPESRLNKTTLLNQVSKLPIASIKVVNETTAEVTAVVPSNVGGWNLHEVGITDKRGKLVYVGNFHGGYRPTLTEGAGGDMELVFTITANNLATVVIEMDGSTLYAPKKWIQDHLLDLIFPIGCKYWTASDVNPEPLFTEAFGKPTYWRQLKGVQMISVDPDNPVISEYGMVAGNIALTATPSNRPQSYTHYTSYCWERYDPAAPIRHNGISRRNGIHKFK